jgi:hypothetical protein
MPIEIPTPADAVGTPTESSMARAIPTIASMVVFFMVAWTSFLTLPTNAFILMQLRR